MRLCLLFILLFLFNATSAQQLGSNVRARVIVVGDGGVLKNGTHHVANAISKYVNKNDNKTTILFVGDNIYRHGLPIDEDRDYEQKQEVLYRQLAPFFNHHASVYVIPGNHDWANGQPVGYTNIRNQAKWVAGLNKQNIKFLPVDGCPGPVEIAIGDSIVLIIMDSQWWLHQDVKPGIGSDCDCKTENEVMEKLNDIAYRNADKKILFASHHPFRSYGIHGGYYTVKQHLFPFTDMIPKAYIPLPIVGSIYPIVRGDFGNVQDLMHPLYKDMVNQIEDVMAQAPNVLYVAGHEHNLQLIKENNRHYIVSGSGSKIARVKYDNTTLFAAAKVGFTEIQYLSDGTQKITFFEVDDNGGQKQLYTYHTVPIPNHIKPVSTYNNTILTPDSVVVSIAPEYDSVNGLHRFLFGEHYRKLWTAPVKLKVFKLSEEKGGLKILQKGGGQQTKSLRLEDKTGKQWVLRTVQKDPEKALPSNLKSTIAKPIVQDQISAANPYAPLTIPTLADAASIPHANPIIVYVPDDTALGIYRKDFANTVCLFEEREPVEGKTYSTLKVLDKLEEDNDNMVDQRAVLRARMFDLLIGDWDRHEDQWRWQKTEKGKKNIFSPIPRDRDQVYFISTGVIPYIAGRNWIMPKFQGFDGNIKNVNGFMFNARHFDRYFLNGLDKEDWIEVIKELQTNLTDEVIGDGIKQLPDTIYAKVGKKITADLISRREMLLKKGLEYYRFLSRSIDIPASDKKDFFSIIYLPNGDVDISVLKIKKDDQLDDTIYHRIIDHKVTNEVVLYGRGDDDVFKVSGDERARVKVRMVGGGKVDSFIVGKNVSNKAKLYVYDRSDKENVLPSKRLAKIKVSDKNEINKYDGTVFKYNKLVPLVTGGYNFDDGILLGGGLSYTKQGFRKEPYSSKHSIILGRAFATDAGFIKYRSDIVDVVGKSDLSIRFNLRAPDNTANFFGIGNETNYENLTDPRIKYYRTRYNFSDVTFNLNYPFGKHINFFSGVIAQYYSIDLDDNEGRFIINYEANNQEQKILDDKWFAGVNAGFEIDTRNSKIIPVRGLHWITTISGIQQLNDDKNYGQLHSELSLLMSFSRNPRIVIGNRIGAGTSLGNPYYFQMFYLGGNGSLQGFRKNRFAGHALFYNNFELRVRLFDFASYLFPGSVGLTVFNDVGRVWARNETSSKWHVGYGAGLFVIPAQTIVINGVLGFSEEGVLPYISLGFRF